jgi:hypothetical protein
LIGQQLPGERLLHQAGCAVVVGKFGVNLDERHTAAGCILRVDTPGKDRGHTLEAGMVEEEPG